MRFTNALAPLAFIASQYLPLTNASPAMSCLHSENNTPPASSATTTAASFVQTTRNQFSVQTAQPAVAGEAKGQPQYQPQEQPPAASITQAPGAEPTKQLDIKFRQTTYYSCVTMGTYTHCGWHEPILDASTSGGEKIFERWSMSAICLVVSVVAVGLL